MRKLLAALIVGLLFGAGLVVSDMVNPARVLAFLDLAGAWDPTLAFVMAGALVPSAIAYLVGRRMHAPLLGGALLFGAGWGLVGFCPGPAISTLSLGYWQPWLFVGAMLSGMLLHRIASSPRRASSALSPQPASDG